MLFIFPVKPHMLQIYFKIAKYLFIIKTPQTELHLDDNTIKSTKVMVSAFQSAHNLGSLHSQPSQLY